MGTVRGGRRRSLGPAGLAAALVVLLVGLPTPGAAQGVRGWASSNFRYLEMQPLQLDTALAGEVTYDADGNARVDGRLIWCTSTPCPFYRPVAVQNAVLSTQDVGFTAWGLGITGLSFTGLVRARQHVSGELQWPLADDPFDVLVGFAELRRGGLRLRAGRQESPSGLGFRAFDGGSARWDATHFWAEGYGGRSLARGLNEPAREALRGIEDFVRDQEAYLFGGAAGLRWGLNRLAFRYQREIWSDEAGLLSERASVDLHAMLPFQFRLEASGDWDVAFNRVGKAEVNLRRPLAGGRILAEVGGRRYVPYFDLNTIWGYFSPVPYHEARVRMSLGLNRETGLRLALAAREYGDIGYSPLLRPLENRGYRAELDGTWRVGSRLLLEAGYDLDWAASAFLHGVDASVSVDVTPDLRVQAAGTSFQQFQAFRLGDGQAYGGTLALDWAVLDRVRLDGRIGIIRQSDGRGGPAESWNQLRGGIGVRYEFGEDPGIRRRRR